jgi:hypothetical protein
MIYNYIDRLISNYTDTVFSPQHIEIITHQNKPSQI